MPKLRLLIDTSQIAAKISEIALKIDRDYADKDLVLVMVLKGAICFTADLIRSLRVPNDLEVVQCRSYHGQQRKELEVIGLDQIECAGRDVLIVDDIFDSGHTLFALVAGLKKKQPRSLKSVVLLSKNVAHKGMARPDYSLFDIENLFVVGYGLDYKERYRGLVGVYVMEEE